MKSLTSITLLVLLIAASWLAPWSAAKAETLTCTPITSLPATISSAGSYCLNSGFTQAIASGAAITINADNVVLDCNDNFIVTSSPSSTASGIQGTNRTHVTIRNCRLRDFTRGIALYENVTGASRNNRLQDNELTRSKIAGIVIFGSSNLVEHNHISENVGSSASGYTYGILMGSYGGVGAGNILRGNMISDIAPSAYVRVTGIYFNNVQDTTIKENTIDSLFPPVDLGVYGIVGGPTAVASAVVGNVITAFLGASPVGTAPPYGGASYDGIRFDAGGSSYNVCRDNTVGHFYSNISGCTKDANTEY